MIGHRVHKNGGVAFRDGITLAQCGHFCLWFMWRCCACHIQADYADNRDTLCNLCTEIAPP